MSSNYSNMNIEKKIHKIFPVIVIYKTTIYDTITYNFLKCNELVTQFMIYDNSPKEYIQHFEIPQNAIYIRDYNNSGVSKAYNTACDYAIKNGYEKIMLLDQDTSFELDYFKKASECSSKVCAPQILLKNNTPFSPCCWSFLRIKGVRLIPGKYNLSKYTLVNSGLCISTDLFQSVGGYNELLRMDFADFEFIKRLQKVHSTFELIDSIAIQDFSNEEKNIDKLFRRYIIFLDSANKLKPLSILDKIEIKWLALLHTIALTIRTKDFIFLKQYMKG